MSAVGARELPGVAVWKRRLVRLGTYGGLAVIAIVMLYPFWSMGIASFRSLEQYQLGHGFSLTSWKQLFHTLPVGRQLLSSAIVTVGAIALILAVSTTARYALGVLRYRFSPVVFLLIVSAMMVPTQSMILPEYVNLSRIGFINHYYGAILVYAALGAPFSTFLMTTYFRRMPEDVVEASLIDGLGYAGIFFKIMLPLAVPAIV